jgi:hypothetical protein
MAAQAATQPIDAVEHATWFHHFNQVATTFRVAMTHAVAKWQMSLTGGNSFRTCAYYLRTSGVKSPQPLMDLIVQRRGLGIDCALDPLTALLQGNSVCTCHEDATTAACPLASSLKTMDALLVQYGKIAVPEIGVVPCACLIPPHMKPHVGCTVCGGTGEHLNRIAQFMYDRSAHTFWAVVVLATGHQAFEDPTTHVRRYRAATIAELNSVMRTFQMQYGEDHPIWPGDDMEPLLSEWGPPYIARHVQPLMAVMTFFGMVHYQGFRDWAVGHPITAKRWNAVSDHAKQFIDDLATSVSTVPRAGVCIGDPESVYTRILTNHVMLLQSYLWQGLTRAELQLLFDEQKNIVDVERDKESAECE